jgi:hypothetical protein
MIRLQCPFCNTIFEEAKDWVLKNKRVFCNNCCKSYDIEIESNEEDEPADTSDSDYSDGFYGL